MFAAIQIKDKLEKYAAIDKVKEENWTFNNVYKIMKN